MKIQTLTTAAFAILLALTYSMDARAQYNAYGNTYQQQGYSQQGYYYQPSNGYYQQGSNGYQQSASNGYYQQQTNGYGQQAYSQPRTYNQSQSYGNGQSSTPTYQQTIAQTGSNNYDRYGNQYQTNAGVGLDQRSQFRVGGDYYGSDRFVGAQGNVGAGLYADTGVSQSGRVGTVNIRNYAEGTAFLGTEAGAQAGINQDGLVVGANGFAGGRATGTIGSDVGAFGYGATGEAWSGVGVEAGLNAGFDDGVLTFGGELGGALGVGGKLGIQASIDVGAVGRDIEGAVQDVGRWGDQAGRDIGNWGNQAGKDIGNWTNQAGKDIGNWTNQAGKDVGKAVNDVGKGIEGAAKDFIGLFGG